MEVSLENATKTIFSIVNGIISLLPNLAVGTIVFVIFLIIAANVRRIPVRICQMRSYPESVGLILGRLSQWIIWAAGVLVALSIVVPSFNAKDLIQLLGVSGVAIGFAFKEVFQNFLAGVIILVSAPFRIGDQIKFGDFQGLVEDIETRATRIRMADGRVAIIPNSKLFTDPVIVEKRTKGNSRPGNDTVSK